MPSSPRHFPPAALLTGGAALGIGLWLVKLFPALELEVFARGAGRLIGLFTGTVVSRGEPGWLVPLSGAPVVITSACSASDYFAMVSALIGFQLARRGFRPLTSVAIGLGAALPVTLLVNAVRIITVAYAHPWVISRLPPVYESFLHMTTGAAVFLPALIALNLLLEAYGRSRSPA